MSATRQASAHTHVPSNELLDSVENSEWLFMSFVDAPLYPEAGFFFSFKDMKK